MSTNKDEEQAPPWTPKHFWERDCQRRISKPDKRIAAGINRLTVHGVDNILKGRSKRVLVAEKHLSTCGRDSFGEIIPSIQTL